MTAPPLPRQRINAVRRFELYMFVLPLAFIAGVASTPAGRQAAADAATFPRGQFDDACANKFFPC